MKANNVNYEVSDHLFADQPTQNAPQTYQVPQMQLERKPPSRHPICTFFHIFWKCAALFTYLFGAWFSDNFVVIFIMCITFLSADFWTVKNVSGRLMVGLRWWNEIKEDGSNVWIFESLEDKSAIFPSESKIFWASIIIAPILWLLFAIVSFLKFNFEWLIIVLIALALNVANIYGYAKCAKDARTRISNLAQSYITTAVVNQAVTNYTNPSKGSNNSV